MKTPVRKDVYLFLGLLAAAGLVVALSAGPAEACHPSKPFLHPPQNVECTTVDSSGDETVDAATGFCNTLDQDGTATPTDPDDDLDGDKDKDGYDNQTECTDGITTPNAMNGTFVRADGSAWSSPTDKIEPDVENVG